MKRLALMIVLSVAAFAGVCLLSATSAKAAEDSVSVEFDRRHGFRTHGRWTCRGTVVLDLSERGKLLVFRNGRLMILPILK